MRGAVGGGLLAFCLASAAGAQTPLVQTQPGHLPPLPAEGGQLVPAQPLVGYPLRSQVLLRNPGAAWNAFGRVDQGLSDACAAHRFTERINLQYRAIFERKDILGVAFGNGTNLVDADRRAQPDMIYLFRHGDSTACVVLVMTQVEFKRANDPNANPSSGAAAKARAKASP